MLVKLELVDMCSSCSMMTPNLWWAVHSLASKRGQSGWAGLGLVAGYSGQIGGSGGADAAGSLPRWLGRPAAVVVWCAALLGA